MTVTRNQVTSKIKAAATLLAAGDFKRFERAFWDNGSRFFSARAKAIETPFEGSAAKEKKSNEDLQLDLFRGRALKSPPPTKNSWWQKLFNPPSYNLSGVGLGYLKDIYSPLYDSHYVYSRLHEQFLEGAEHYAEYYVAHEYYKYNIERSLAAANFTQRGGLNILDIGSGVGNTVFPLLDLFPDSNILASELSLPMLVQLKKKLDHAHVADRCALLQLDAEVIDFQPGSFDLVVGGAILHHLFRPEVALQSVGKVLKPGGLAIFFEPFAPGNKLLQLILHLILDQNVKTKEKISAAVEKYARIYIEGLETTAGTDKNHPKYLQIDDKWVFPVDYFLNMAKQSGFSDCQLISLHDLERPFELQLETILCKYGAIDRASIPNWVFEIAASFDKTLNEETKRSLLIEACVVLKR